MKTERNLLCLLAAIGLMACSGNTPDSMSVDTTEAAPVPQTTNDDVAQAASANPAVDAAVDLGVVLASSFRARGQAGLDRLERNAMQTVCSQAPNDHPAAEVGQAIMAAATAAVVFPAEGQFVGDWKAGEKVAQTGTGLQYSDDPALPNGGNCYACHQLDPKEIAYGTLGPPLVGYGKMRGRSEEMLKYTWTRIWNSHAYNPCSHMPRFGEAGILTEQQIKDLMGLLFDPQSPVNL